MKKKINTAKMKKLLMIDIIAIIILYIYSSHFWSISFLEALGIGFILPIQMLFQGLINMKMLIRLYLFFAAGGTLIAVLVTFPLNIIYLAIRKLYKTKIIKSTTFNSIDDIEYYREKFENLSPAVISTVADFEVEYKKDLTATVMSLYIKKKISFDNNTITVISKETDMLDSTERHVLEKLSKNSGVKMSNVFNMFDRNQFEKLSKKEAESKGFIVKKISDKTLKITLFILLILFVICLKIKSTLNFYDEELLNQSIERMDPGESVDNDRYLIEYFENEENEANLKQFFDEFSKVLIYGIAVFGIIIIPIYAIVFGLLYKKFKLEYKRTQKGNLLVEKIYGMKNYIHDYSLLSEASKEQIILWDEFLIYAILLEENTEVVREISKMKNVVLPSFD